MKSWETKIAKNIFGGPNHKLIDIVKRPKVQLSQN